MDSDLQYVLIVVTGRQPVIRRCRGRRGGVGEATESRLALFLRRGRRGRGLGALPLVVSNSMGSEL